MKLFSGILVGMVIGAGGVYLVRGGDAGDTTLHQAQTEEIHKKRYESHPCAKECDLSEKCELKEADYLCGHLRVDDDRYQGRNAQLITDRINVLAEEARGKGNAAVLARIQDLVKGTKSAFLVRAGP